VGVAKTLFLQIDINFQY